MTLLYSGYMSTSIVEKILYHLLGLESAQRRTSNRLHIIRSFRAWKKKYTEPTDEHKSTNAHTMYVHYDTARV